MMDFIPTAHAAPLSSIYEFGRFNSAGEFISRFISPAINIFGLIILFYIIYAGYKYLASGGNKDDIAQAQAMIRNSITALIIFFALFLFITLLQQAFGLGNIVVSP